MASKEIRREIEPMSRYNPYDCHRMVIEEKDKEIASLKEQLDLARAEIQGLSRKLVEVQTERNQWELEAKKYCAELGEMKILEEQGLLVRLPCKVGDAVWDIDFKRPTPSMITGFSCGVRSDDEDECDDKDEIRMYSMGLGIENSFPVSEIGKTVFLTKEEAEKALVGSGAE